MFLDKRRSIKLTQSLDNDIINFECNQPKRYTQDDQKKKKKKKKWIKRIKKILYKL